MPAAGGGGGGQSLGLGGQFLQGILGGLRVGERGEQLVQVHSGHLAGDPAQLGHIRRNRTVPAGPQIFGSGSH
jgi:hypothetical protein